MPNLINPYRFGSAFTPTDLANLEVWLDASDTNTLYDATSGGSLVTNGNIVRRIEDKSGNGRHFTQGSTTTTRLGIRVDSGRNGLTTLESQSGQTSLHGYGVSATLSLQKQTVVMVFCPTSSGVTGHRWFTEIDSSNTDTGTNSIIPLNGQQLAGTISLGVWANAAHRAMVSYSANTWYRRYCVVGASTITHKLGATSASYTYTQPSYSISKLAVLGKADTTSNTGPYKFAELLVYSRELDSTDLTKIDDYITAKWGSGLT